MVLCFHRVLHHQYIKVLTLEIISNKAETRQNQTQGSESTVLIKSKAGGYEGYVVDIFAK